ncbi:Glutamyl-tRNA(Gln) amidotransferase subunit C, mitochondrial [Sergentomyia squamirostris]
MLRFRRGFWPIFRSVRCYSASRSDIKIPGLPIKSFSTESGKKIPEISSSKVLIDANTIHLLERLSLVDIDSKEALKIVTDSIAFADKILEIDTKGVEPLYTVLEDCDLQLRVDRVSDGNIREEVLKNASVTEEEYFVAPPGNIPLEKDPKSFS